MAVYIYTLLSKSSRRPSNSISNEVRAHLHRWWLVKVKSNYELLLNNCIDGFQKNFVVQLKIQKVAHCTNKIFNCLKSVIVSHNYSVYFYDQMTWTLPHVGAIQNMWMLNLSIFFIFDCCDDIPNIFITFLNINNHSSHLILFNLHSWDGIFEHLNFMLCSYIMLLWYKTCMTDKEYDCYLDIMEDILLTIIYFCSSKSVSRVSHPRELSNSLRFLKCGI